MKKIIIILIQFSIALSSYSKEIVNELEEIEVVNLSEKSENISSGKNVKFNQEDLEEISPSSLDDILQSSTDVTTAGGPRSSGEEIQIRGLKARKLFIYIDGVKQNFSSDHSTMTAIDPDLLKSVDIYKSTSNFSRSGSVGGGIEYKTKSASDFLKGKEKLGNSFKFGHRTSNDENYFSFKSFSRYKKNDLLFSISRRNASDQKIADQKVLENSSFQDESLLIKTSNELTKEFSFELSFENFEREDRSPVNPTLDPPQEITELNGINIIKRQTYRGEGNYNPQSKLVNISSTGYLTKHKLEKVRRSDNRVEKREIETRGVNLKNRSSIEKLSINSGGEIVIDHLKGSRNGGDLPSYPKGESSQRSIFFEGEYPILDIASISGGLRAQSFSLSSDSKTMNTKSQKSISKKAGLSTGFLSWPNLNINYSEGFNAIKIQDIYVDGLHHKGDGFFISDNFFIPNEKLVYEKSKMLELTGTFEKNIFSSYDRLKLEVSYYWNNVENYIYLEKVEGDPDFDTTGTTQFVNIPEVAIKGRGASISYLYDQIELGVSYTRMRAVNKKLGLFLADIPADQYNYKLNYYLDQYGLSFGYLGINALKQDRINRETLERTDETPSYFIHNVFMKKSFHSGVLKNLSLLGRVNNITNRRYRKHGSNIEEVGKDFKFSVDYKIAYF